MNDQHIANEWAEPGDVTPDNANPEPVNDAVDSPADSGKKKWSRAAIAAAAAALVATGAIGYGIGAYATHHDGPSAFLGGPGDHRGPDGKFGPDGQRPPHPGDQDLNNNGIEDHHEPGFEAGEAVEDGDA